MPLELPCGCAPQWLTTVSQPITAEEAVAEPCRCCEAPARRRCIGGRSGWLPQDLKRPGERRAHVQVCPARLALDLVAAGASDCEVTK
jgi:hypothetical protein